MISNYLKIKLKTAVLAVTVLLLAVGVSFAQSVGLTAVQTSTTLPDGQVVQMWGYSCGAVTGSVSCSALNGTTTWSPVKITVPTGTNLSITLTNSLPVPTSLTIVGQLGGGLGDVSQRTTTASPDHSSLSSNTATWPIAGDTPGFAPPAQDRRVQSFGTEVAPTGSVTLPPWNALKPGTYLIESGTHPSIQGPMGLYGVLVVTTAPVTTTPTLRGTAYPGVNYD